MNLEDASQYWIAFFIGVATCGGVGALFIWSWMRGSFRNVEAPKHRLLELEKKNEVKL